MTNEEIYTPYVEWRRVPQRVVELLPYALTAKLAHEKAAVAAGIASITAATWMPELNAITVYTPEPLSKAALDIYEREMVDGERNVAVVPMDVTPNWDEEIVIKQGALIPGLPTVWNTGNKLLGGPTPLSNGIVASVLGAGAGYGAGALAEQLFPERYIQRGKLRRTLAAIGALGGVGLAGVNAYANARALRTGMLRGLVTHNETPVVSPYEQAKLEKESFDQFGGDFLRQQMNQQLGMSAMQQANQQQFMQQGMFNQQQQQSSLPPMYQPSVPVAQFNNAMWNDVRKGMTNGFDNHTPPQYAAATTGLMSGISANNNSPIIRPIDVVTGIASAGVGLATAHVVGKTLSALAGLTPAGQNKLQDMGLWGGMMHAIVPSMFGR